MPTKPQPPGPQLGLRKHQQRGAQAKTRRSGGHCGSPRAPGGAGPWAQHTPLALRSRAPAAPARPLHLEPGPSRLQAQLVPASGPTLRTQFRSTHHTPSPTQPSAAAVTPTLRSGSRGRGAGGGPAPYYVGTIEMPERTERLHLQMRSQRTTGCSGALRLQERHPNVLGWRDHVPRVLPQHVPSEGDLWERRGETEKCHVGPFWQTWIRS